MVNRETMMNNQKRLLISTPENDRGLYYFSFAFKFKKALEDLGYNVTFDEDELGNSDAVFLTSKDYSNSLNKRAKRHGIPTVLVGLVSEDFLKVEDEEIKLRKTKLASKVSLVLVNSQIEKDFFLRNEVINKIEILKVIKPVLYKNNISRLEKEAFIRANRLFSNQKIVIITGILSSKKQVEAAENLARILPDWQFVFIGTLLKDKKIAEKLNRKTKNFNLSYMYYMRPEFYASILANASLVLNLNPTFLDLWTLQDIFYNRIPFVSPDLPFLSDIFDSTSDYIEIDPDDVLNMFGEIKHAVTKDNLKVEKAYQKVSNYALEKEYLKLDEILLKLFNQNSLD